ncbi:hypothetical protein B0I37DRAFT_21119 [Chaetomium sp. MPI-CAGE-AT-0009]|nr:hypothetical protein B0I37DRAFT_21119 [Chaetomium sp. MPI-CAGE-AT-0009]
MVSRLPSIPPEGIADCVGYWAEARILGGVMLFDRRDPELVKGAAPDAVYVHADRDKVIYRICRLLEDQKEQLAQFLRSRTTRSQRSPLPVPPSEVNRERVDPGQAIETTGIYRDIWERRLRLLGDGDLRVRDAVDTFNYLSFQDWCEANRRGHGEMDKREMDECVAV